MRKHAGDGLGSYRDQRFTLRALGRPWESCDITSSTAMTVKGHPITRALGDGLRYGSCPDPPCALPWDPRSAGESSRGPRASAAGSPEPHREVSRPFALAHWRRPRAAAAAEAAARAPLRALLGDRLPNPRAGGGRGSQRERCALNKVISANVPNPRRGKRVNNPLPTPGIWDICGYHYI